MVAKMGGPEDEHEAGLAGVVAIGEDDVVEQQAERDALRRAEDVEADDPDPGDGKDAVGDGGPQAAPMASPWPMSVRRPSRAR